jgi:hypothetical protein
MHQVTQPPKPSRQSQCSVTVRHSVAIRRGRSRPFFHTRPGSPVLARLSAADGREQAIDGDLSKRDLALDPLGYFIIKLDRDADPPMIQADYYSNTINEKGLACDDEGEVIGCGSGSKKFLRPLRVFRGRTAKEVSVEILESQGVGVPCEYCSHLEHANYLGRELQKAEFCMSTGATYVQD